MVLDHSLASKMQIGSLSALGHSPGQISPLLKYYLLACKVDGKSPLTIASYSQRVGEFTKFIGQNNLSDEVASISSNEVRLFLLHLIEKEVNPSTINAYYRVLKTFFNWLVNESILGKSPMVAIKPPRVPRKIIKPFSPQDIERLLLMCSGDRFLEVRSRAMVLVFLDTGLRLAELSNIQLSDIDLDRETIKVMGKGAKERVVRIGRTTQKAILRYLLMRKDDHPCLWVTEERKPMTKVGVQTAIKRLCRMAEIIDAKPGPHTFRHTFATTALRNGASTFEVQSLLGHSTLDMTRRYTATLNSEEAVIAHKRFSPVDNLFK